MFQSWGVTAGLKVLRRRGAIAPIWGATVSERPRVVRIPPSAPGRQNAKEGSGTNANPSKSARQVNESLDRGKLMDLTSYLKQWKGKEVAAYCGPIKYRGMLGELMGDGFLLLTDVAVMNPMAQETLEYKSCVLNIDQISGIATEEVVGRGGNIADELSGES